jgi:hypothetical protein
MGVSGGDLHRKMAERTTILRVPAGSNLHGLNVPGHDDTDEVGICVEDIGRGARVLRVRAVHLPDGGGARRQARRAEPARRSRPDHLQPAEVPAAGDAGQPADPAVPVRAAVTSAFYRDARGAQLQELAPLIVSRHAGARYLGYLEAQRQRLLGSAGRRKPTGRSWKPSTATTPSTRCTSCGSAFRASS